jgi:mxaJ protein
MSRKRYSMTPAAPWVRLLAVAGACGVAAMAAAAAAPNDALRVCADPNNLPFSNQRLEGFENKLAELVAAELDATPEYTWTPQRRGFIRRTLNAQKCDLVMGVPSGYEPLLTTKPYYRSTYVFAYAKSKGLELHSFDDPVLRQLRIGLQELVDDRSNPPPAHELARRGIVQNMVGFPMWDVDSVEDPPGRIIEAVAKGEIDVAIVWGPFAGYFAKRQPTAIEVVPVLQPIDEPWLPIAYDISMGVRRGDEALKARIEGILDRRHDDIQRILDSYGVPLVADTTPALRP